MDILLAVSADAGINVTELGGRESPIVFRRQPVIAMLGRTLSGPLNEPVLVESAQEFTRSFGGPWAESWLPDAALQFFAAGGHRLVVIRVANGAKAARLVLPPAVGGLTVVSRFPGNNESLRADVDIATPDGCMHMTLQRVVAGRVVDQEFFQNVSLRHGDERNVRTALSESRLVRVAPPSVATTNDDLLPRVTGQLVVVSQAGSDGSALSDYDLIGCPDDGSGLFALDALDQIDFVYVPPEPHLAPRGPVFETVARRYCDSRSALLVMDPAGDAVDPDVERSGQAPPVLRYWPPVVDRRDRTRRVPVGGAVLGALADYQRNSYGDFGFSADRTRIGRRFLPAPEVGQRSLGALTEVGLFVLAPRRDQTLGVHSASMYVPEFGCRCSLHTLRLVLLIERALKESTRWVVAHAADREAWLALASQVSRFLGRLARAGLIVEPYRVRCDANTNAAQLQGQPGTHFLVSVTPREFARPLTLAVTQAPAGAHITRAAFSE
ncbi:MAG: hypothetical protein AAFX44_01275 [Pseudomonadota bacterium]